MIQIMSYIPKQISHAKNGNFWPNFYKELPKNSMDIVYMGNSHSKTTFIPEIIDDILGTESIHVNTSGESIYQTIYEYQEVLRYQNPKMAVLETFTIYDGLDQDGLKSWNFSFFYSMPLSLRKIIYGHRFFSEADLLKFYLPFTSNHANWKNPSLVISRIFTELKAIKNRLSSGNRVDLPHRGYENYLKSLLPNEIKLKTTESISACQISDFEERLSVLKEILEIDKIHSGQMILIEAPQFINEYENCSNEVIDLAGSYQTSYESLLKEQGRSTLWFGDKQHMTQFGAIIASVEIAELLADKLDITVNQEKLDYYRSYFFRDYTLVQDGGDFTIRLIPYENEVITDLVFIWEIFLDGESIYKFEEKGKNELVYSLPKQSGDAYVLIKINNPASNYLLRGRIDIVLENE